MTVPKMRTMNRGGARYYIHPVTKEKAAGVTSVVGMLPKDFLKWWAAKMVAQAAVEQFGTLAQFVANGETEAGVNWLKSAHQRDVGQASAKGTEVHDMVEKVTEAGGIPRGLKRDLHPYARGWLAFLEAVQPTILEQETTVWSTTHGYSGTLDLSMSIPESTWEDEAPSWWEGSEVPILGDVKTTRSGIHADVALQLAAYRAAEEKMTANAEGAFEPEPWPVHQKTGLVVWLRPDEWKLVPVDIGDEVFDIFKALREVFRWEKEMREEVIYPELIGDVWTEEDIVDLEKVLKGVAQKKRGRKKT